MFVEQPIEVGVATPAKFDKTAAERILTDAGMKVVAATSAKPKSAQ